MGGHSYGGAKAQTPIYRCTSHCAESSVIVAKRAEEHVLALVDTQRAAWAATPEADDFATLDQVAEAAEGFVQELANDLDSRRMLGEAGWREALTIRVNDRDAKVAQRDAAARKLHLASLTTKLADLDHDGLRDFLDGVVRQIFVRRRRGGTAGERMLIVWRDDPTLIAVPGPHRSGPFEPIEW
jgi:hypothetical protein